MMYIEALNSQNIELAVSDISGEDFSIAFWWWRDSDSTAFRQFPSLLDGSSNYLISSRSSGTTTHVRHQTSNGNNVGPDVQDVWSLALLTWDASEEDVSLHIANENGSDTSVLDIGGSMAATAVLHVFHAFSGNGRVGCWAIRPGELLDLSDAQAMYNSKFGHAPMTYNNGLSLSGLIAGNYGLAQLPTGDGVSANNGRRIGSDVASGDYLISEDGDLGVARPVTISGSLTYSRDESGFFEPEVPSVASGTVENAATLKRWADGQPRGQERIAVMGNSRVVRDNSFAAVGSQTDVPFGYCGSWFCGLALHDLSTLGGVLGMRIRLAGLNAHLPGFDLDEDHYFTSGTVDEITDDDAQRLWIESVSASGPSRPVRLETNGTVSIKCRHLDGSLIDKAEAINVGVVYARGPGFSDFDYRAVEAATNDLEGDFTGSAQSTTDADTTEFTVMHDGINYTPATRTLRIDGEHPEIEAGWLVSIVDGTGYRSVAQVESIDSIGGGTTTVILKHVFRTEPDGTSLFAFGPWSYGTANVVCPSSSDDYRGIWVQHSGAVASNELGAYILAANCWRSDVPCFHWARLGWGGNGFTPQTEETFDGVPTAMMQVLEIDTALMTDGYQNSTPIADEFPLFATLLEQGGAEVIYAIGQANSQDEALEDAYATFALGQSERAAICVTDDPRIGTHLEQYGYSGKQNGAHPSIETFVRVAEAMAELAAEAFTAPAGGGGRIVVIPDLGLGFGFGFDDERQ